MWHPLPRYFYSPRYCLSLWHRSYFGSSWIEAGASVKLKAVYQPQWVAPIPPARRPWQVKPFACNAAIVADIVMFTLVH